MNSVFDGRTILITGGTGSLGQTLTKHCLGLNAKSVRVLSRNEFYQVEMKRKVPEARYFIGDVRDRDRLDRAMDGVDIVFHTAAMKHVDMCEYNPIESVKTNVDGAINVIDSAINNNVKKVLAISTDKAVQPINIYGATKLVSEKLFIHANVYGATKFSCVRYGNFWGSSGSIIPLWEKQKETGEITITDKNMSRYWITLDEASAFAVTCIERMKGGEVFIPLMPSQTLEQLAHSIAPDAKMKVIGKRPGEKLHELLISEDEVSRIVKDRDCIVVMPEDR